MTNRNLSVLNSQVVLNSGTISNPDNRTSIIRNSQRVRNDLVNLSEYINGLVYYLIKNLTNADTHPYDAAQDGISGLTVVSNTLATSTFGDVFWLSTGENTGRPKTIKESLETIEAKLIQQNVNISLLERVDLTNLSSAVNTTNALAYKVKNNVLGVDFNTSTNDLTFPLAEYVYKLYATLFPGVDASELTTNSVGFPALSFSTEVSQNDIPGCGNYLTLAEELRAIKMIISGAACDPDFTIALDQQVFETEPTNIKGYLEELIDKATELGVETLTNANDIASIETQIGGLQGAVTATETVAGISEQATEQEILMGLNFSGNNNLFINPSSLCDAILNTTSASFFGPGMRLGPAWKKATEMSVDDVYENQLKNTYSTYLNLDANVNTSFVGAFNRHYTVNSRDTQVTITMSNFNLAVEGQLFRLKNSGVTGTVVLSPGAGYTIDGDASITLNAKDCVTIMFTGTSDHIVINRYTAS